MTVGPRRPAAPAAPDRAATAERARLRDLAAARLRERDERLAAREAREERARARAERAAAQQLARAERESKQAERAAAAEVAAQATLAAAAAGGPRAGEARGALGLLIHIGLRKAGSASIQSFLSANEAALREAGFDYPAAGRQAGRKAHHAIAHDLRAATKGLPDSGALDDLERRWREGPPARLILSSEMFEGAKRRECRELADRLGAGPEAVRVLMVIRDLVDLTPSSYAQKVRYGHNTFDFDAFFAHRITQPRVDYHQTARAWADAFGWRSLRVRVLDPRLLKNGDLIDEVLAVAGAPADLKLERPGAVNAAPGWRVLEAVRALYDGRHGLPEGHPLAAAAADHVREARKRVGVAAEGAGERLGWNRERGRYMTLDQAERCLEEYRAAIATFNAQLTAKIPEPLDLAERGFVARDQLPDVGLIEPALLRGFYDAVWEALPKKMKAGGAA